MSNQSENAVAINKFRTELKAMCNDISQIDRKVLTRSVDAGLADVKKNTPIGQYPAGSGKVGGTMRKNWSATQVEKIGGGIEKTIENPVEYAMYVNDGHRTVNQSGETTGFVEGQHMLEHAVHMVDQAMERQFEIEVRAVQQRHDN